MPIQAALREAFQVGPPQHASPLICNNSKMHAHSQWQSDASVAQSICNYSKLWALGSSCLIPAPI